VSTRLFARLASGMQTLSCGRGLSVPMPTGRFEKRTARAVAVEIRPRDEGMLKETTLTENVSPHGARVFMKREWRPGQPVVVFAPEEGVWSSAQIVYCHRLTESRFAVGLELSGRVEQWARPF
jgi:PilZ domain